MNMNFDLEDGQPKITIVIKPDDVPRFTAFMQHCTDALPVMRELRDYAENATLPEDDLPQCVLDADDILKALK